MTIHEQIASWVNYGDNYQFIDNVNGDLEEVKEGRLQALDSISDNSGSTERNARITRAYETIHKYIAENIKKLDSSDAELIDKLAARIMTVGFSLKCTDSQLSHLYKISEKLTKKKSQHERASEKAIAHQVEVECVARPSWPGPGRGALVPLPQLYEQLPEKTPGELLRTLKKAKKQLTTHDLSQAALNIYNRLRRKTVSEKVLDSDCVENAFEDVKLKCCRAGVVRLKTGECLHANEVSRYNMRHIASQAPQSALAKERFWKMAFRIPGGLIVDLTNQRDIVNFPQLQGIYPEQGQLLFFGPMQIKFVSAREEEHHVTVYKYEVEPLRQGNEPQKRSRTVTRIHYQNWQDFSRTDADQIKNLISILDKEMQKQETHPIVCCKDGAGRTGTFITARMIKKLFHIYQERQYPLSPQVLQDTIEEIILDGRQCRGPWFVNNLSQIKTLLAFAATLSKT